MKKVIPLFFLILFILSQSHLIEAVVDFESKSKPPENKTEKSMAEDEESNKENKSKESDADEKYYPQKTDFILLTPNVFTNTFNSETIFHAHPFHEDDIKPPRLIS